MSSPKPFAQKAANVSLITAIAVLAVGAATKGVAEDKPFVSLAISVALVLVLLVSVVCGVVALLGIPKHGPKGILKNSLAALGIDGLMIGFGVVVFVLASRGSLSTPDDLEVRSHLIGTWERREPEGDYRTELHLGQDNAFRFLMTGRSIADFSGRWSVQNKRLYLNIESFVDGNQEAIGNKVVWSIDHLSDNEVVLGAKNGQDRYTRLAPIQSPPEHNSFRSTSGTCSTATAWSICRAMLM